MSHRALDNSYDAPYMPSQYTPRAFDFSDPLLYQGLMSPTLYQPALLENDAFSQVFTPITQPPPAPVVATPQTYNDDLDEDAEGDTEGDGSDDDYVPSPLLQDRKRLPSSRNTVSHLDTALNSSLSLPIHSYRPRSRPAKRSRPDPVPREIESSDQVTARTSNPWACPHPGCDWIQSNKRTPDLKRHIKKHDPPEWQCNGCHRKFSRRDALRRHVRNKNNPCVDIFSGEG